MISLKFLFPIILFLIALTESLGLGQIKSKCESDDLFVSYPFNMNTLCFRQTVTFLLAIPMTHQITKYENNLSRSFRHKQLLSQKKRTVN